MADIASIYDRLHGATQYRPLSAETFADWSLEAGDIVRVTKDGVNHDTPVMQSSLRWNGAGIITIESEGEKDRDPLSNLSKESYSSGGGGGNAYRSSVRTVSKIEETDNSISLVVGKKQINPSNILTYASRSAFPNPGQIGKYYKALDTGRYYTWTLGGYVERTVTGDGKNQYYTKAGEIALAFNEQTGESQASIDATHIKIGTRGTKTVTLTSTDSSIIGLFDTDNNGNIILDSGSGMIVRRTENGSTVENGIWDKGELSAGMFVEKQAGGTTYTKIKGSTVQLGDDNTSSVSVKDAFEVATYNNIQSIKLKKQTLLQGNNLYVNGGDIKVAPLSGSGGKIEASEHNVVYGGSLTFEGRTPSSADPSIGRDDALGLKDASAHAKITGPVNNVYTLWYLPAKTAMTSEISTPSVANGWVSGGTFSRAVTGMTYAWGTGAAVGQLTVTAHPQEYQQTILGLVTDGSWSGNTYTGKIKYYDGTDDETTYETGYTFTVNGSGGSRVSNAVEVTGDSSNVLSAGKVYRIETEYKRCDGTWVSGQTKLYKTEGASQSNPPASALHVDPIGWYGSEPDTDATAPTIGSYVQNHSSGWVRFDVYLDSAYGGATKSYRFKIG